MRDSKKTRKKITESAIECFAKDGIFKTKFADVARRANISNQLFGHHYKDFNSLFLAVIESILEKLTKDMLKYVKNINHTPKKKLEKYIEFYFIWARKNPKIFYIWINFYNQSIIIPEFRELNTSIREQARERISNILYEGMAKGEFKISDASQVGNLTLHIQGYLTGNWILSMSENIYDSKKMAKESFKMVGRWINML